MELLQLRYFCTVAELESISQAAKIHMIPQPAMSKTISKLEEELDETLFDRVGRHIRLNSKGQIFYNYVKQSILLLGDAKTVIKLNSEEQAFELMLLLNSTRDITHKFILGFSKTHPQVSYYIDQHVGPDISMADMLNFHYCIGTVNPHHSFDRYEDLLHEQMVVAVNSDHPFAQRKKLHVKDLSEQDFVLLNKRYSMHSFVLEYLETRGIIINVKAYCSSSGFLQSAVREGWAMSFFPERSWKYADLSGIALVPLADAALYQTQRIYWSSKRFLPPVAKRFKDELVSYFHAFQTNETGSNR